MTMITRISVPRTHVDSLNKLRHRIEAHFD